MSLKNIFLYALCPAILLTGMQSFAQHPNKSRTYYVSLSGDDANPGTKVAPYKTLNKVNGLTLLAGDTVCFKSGEVFNGSLILNRGTHGTPKKPVVITCYGRGYATINARDSVGIEIYQATNIKLLRLALTGSGRKTGNVKDGLAIINCTHIVADDLNISGFQKSGLRIYSSQNIVAKKVLAHDNGSAGITVEGAYQKRESSDIKILNCRAENNPGDPTNLTNHSGNGIVVGNCENVLIDHCTATNNGWDMPRIGNGPVGIWAYEADRVIIQHCLSYQNKTSKGGADGGGFDLDGGVTNSTVQYNVSYGNQGSGYCIFQYWGAGPWHDNIFRYNISENDGTVSDSQAGLYVWNSSDDEKQFYNCQVYGNIIYNNKVAAICFSEKSESKGISFYNNVFVGRDSLIRGIDKIGDVKYSGNDWWSIESRFNIDGIKDLKAWTQKTGKEQQDGRITGLNIKPDFKNAGNTTITSASQLKTFGNYQLPKNPSLKKVLAYHHPAKVNTAGNHGFENGLSGWTTVGSVDMNNTAQRSGNSCVKIGEGYGAVLQHVPVEPLTIISYNAYLKTSDTTVKGYSFIHFYNAQHKQLLAYRSAAANKANYQQTGNYTETPPGTSYVEIGVEKDSTGKGYVYTDDFSIETNIGEPKVKRKPLVNLDEYMRPFWKLDTVYNETVLLYSVNGRPADGRLLYTPDKILSVKKFDLSKSYSPRVDYTVDGNMITKTQNSTMPFRADTSFDTKKDLAWYNLQSQWVVVTYTHHDKWNGPIPGYKGDRVPGIIAKLKAKEPVKIAAFGMSITRGMDVSSYDTVPPYMPTYVDLFARRLREKYGYPNIKLYNAGLPGSVVDWAAKYAREYINPLKPDLVIIDFGMNDFWRFTPEQFKGYIQTIISKIKAANPKVEFLLLSNMKFDPDYVLDSDKYKAFYQGNLEGYSHVLKAMETKGIINLDMTTLSDALFQRKKAKDCIVNPLHPNDYMARWYAQGLAALLIK